MISSKKDARRKKIGTASSPRTSATQDTQMQHVTHAQMQTKPLTTTCNKIVSARHEIRKKRDARRKKMEPRQAQGQAQHKPHKCNISRIPKCRPTRSQQPATNLYQRHMRSKRMDARRTKVGTATRPRTSTIRATQMRHGTHSRLQTKALTTTCNKCISTKY